MKKVSELVGKGKAVEERQYERRACLVGAVWKEEEGDMKTIPIEENI